MPGAVHVIDVGRREILEPVALDELHQAFAVQDVEDGERPAPGAHFVHRRLVELAPFDGELQPVDAFDAFLARELREVAAHARAPVDHRAEDVEQACFDVRGGDLCAFTRHESLLLGQNVVRPCFQRVPYPAKEKGTRRCPSPLLSSWNR
jgi:hypothetical protein